MEKVMYNEPEFNVVIAYANDVITTSDPNTGVQTPETPPGGFITPPTS